MIEIFRKKAGLLIRELYFAPGIVESAAQRDIDVYVQCRSPVVCGEPFWTLLTDLSHDEDVLFSRLATSHRQKVRRAGNKDGLVVDVNFAPTNSDMETFATFFNEFAAFRGIEKANVPKLEVFRDAGHFSIASVWADNQNMPLAMLSFVSDGYRARQYIGGTSPRVDEAEALIGRANRLLTWQTMRIMKNAGLKIYDFGGVSRGIELQGIDNNKRQFGGIETEEYSALLGVSRLGRLVLKTSNLLNRLNKVAKS